MTLYRLSCGHTFEAENVDHELRDRIECPPCMAHWLDGSPRPLPRYIVEIRP